MKVDLFEGIQYTCILIALDRALAFRYPLQIDRWATPDRAKYALALIGVFAVCLNSPTFFEIKYVEGFGLGPREFRFSDAYTFWYKIVVHLALLYVGPFTLLLSMNGILLYNLRNIAVSNF